MIQSEEQTQNLIDAIVFYIHFQVRKMFMLRLSRHNWTFLARIPGVNEIQSADGEQ